jgi:hypothetical protein
MGGRNPGSPGNVDRWAQRRPVGSAPNTFLLGALSRVVLLDVPLMTTEQNTKLERGVPVPDDAVLRYEAHR